MATYHAKYVDGKLQPYSQAVEEAWSNFARFEVLEVKIRRHRSNKSNGLYRALLGHVCKALEASGKHITNDDLHREIKIHLGYYKLREMPAHIARITGRTHEIDYISTGFDRMSEDEFRVFVTKAVAVINEHICPYLIESDSAAQVNNILAEFMK